MWQPCECYYGTYIIYFEHNAKTTQVFDNVRQRVVEYGILNEFAERIQISYSTTSWSNYQTRVLFLFYHTFREIFVNFDPFLYELQQFFAKMIKKSQLLLQDLQIFSKIHRNASMYERT